jgi:hypothetical protein
MGDGGNDGKDWHLLFGVGLFNQCWELINKADRTEDENVEMLLRAMTSRWHWEQVGGPEQVATGDWQIAHVASLLGLGDLALVFARRNLDTTSNSGWNDWRLASAHEGMARACAAAGDVGGYERHAKDAAQALENEPDPENRQHVADQLASIPRP